MALDLNRFRTSPNTGQLPQQIKSAPVATATLAQPQSPKVSSNAADIIIPQQITVYDKFGNAKEITLNERQHEFATLLANRKSCVLIGAAGTGKTTCTQAGITALMQNANCLYIQDTSHKYLRAGSAGIIITAYTRRATSNIARQMSADIQGNCITTHKTLEFAPVFYEDWDTVTSKYRKKRVFEPKRNELNKLCSNIQTVIIDEASMLSVELYNMLIDALPLDCQMVFIGDLNQLPPCFGSAILGYKLLELPVIELTEVHRQALESPILKLAHRVLSGQPIFQNLGQHKEFEEKGKLQIIPYPKPLTPEKAMLETIGMFERAYDAGTYDIEQDIILCMQTNDNPENDRRFNCTQINKHLAHHFAIKRNSPTFEIVAGFRKFYFAVGDKVIYDKQDARIISIVPNDSYAGGEYQKESINLNYFGLNPIEYHNMQTNDSFDIDAMLRAAEENEQEGMKLCSSHIVKIQLDDTHNEMDAGEGEYELATVGELMRLDLGYAMTVYKAQGSEYRKVYFVVHKSHNGMLSREQLYTAITRAREQLIIICESDTLAKGIIKQEIKGNTLAEKAEFFKGKPPLTEKVTRY